MHNSLGYRFSHTGIAKLTISLAKYGFSHDVNFVHPLQIKTWLLVIYNANYAIQPNTIFMRLILDDLLSMMGILFFSKREGF